MRLIFDSTSRNNLHAGNGSELLMKVLLHVFKDVVLNSK